MKICSTNKIVPEGKAGPSRFACLSCGTCCLGSGGVHTDASGALKIANYLNKDLQSLIKEAKLGIKAPGVYSVLSLPGKEGPCVFLEDSRCLIHPVKPALCRAWPFLPGLLKDREVFYEAKCLCGGLADLSHDDFIKDFKTRGSTFPPKSFLSEP